MDPSLRPRAGRRFAVAAALLALALAGCGGGGDSASPATPEDAVKETILKWTFEADCNLMTDKFLEQQASVGDTRAQRCKTFEDTFQKPQYSRSDVKFRKIVVTGNTAVATVGSDIANITADYRLIAAGGRWRIDEVDL